MSYNHQCNNERQHPGLLANQVTGPRRSAGDVGCGCDGGQQRRNAVGSASPPLRPQKRAGRASKPRHTGRQPRPGCCHAGTPSCRDSPVIRDWPVMPGVGGHGRGASARRWRHCHCDGMPLRRVVRRLDSRAAAGQQSGGTFGRGGGWPAGCWAHEQNAGGGCPNRR